MILIDLNPCAVSAETAEGGKTIPKWNSRRVGRWKGGGPWICIGVWLLMMFVLCYLLIGSATHTKTKPFVYRNRVGVTCMQYVNKSISLIICRSWNSPYLLGLELYISNAARNIVYQDRFSWSTWNCSYILKYRIYLTVFTLSIQTPQLLTINVQKFEPVQFTTWCCVQKLLDEWQTV